MTDLSDPAFWLPVLLGIAAVLLACLGLWRQRQDRRISKAAIDLLRTMRKEIRTNARPSTLPQPGIIPNQELRKRDELEWKKLKDVAKAIGWVWDRMSEGEDD